MDQKKIDRINELARKSKTPEGLTAAEQAERQVLRQEYIQEFRATLKQQLDATVIVEPDGTRRKLAPKAGQKPKS